MSQNFNDLPWHDAELKKITIDRDQDNIRILVQWPEENDSECVSIEFYDCYALQADMHFGIAPPDFILDAECISQSQELEDVKNLWKTMGLNISELYCYTINTNSTNSRIKIFASNFRIIEPEKMLL